MNESVMNFSNHPLTRVPNSGKGGGYHRRDNKGKKGGKKGKGKGKRGQYGDQRGWNTGEEYLERCLLTNPWHQFGFGEKYVIDMDVRKGQEQIAAGAITHEVSQQPPPPPPPRDISFLLPKPIHSKVCIYSKHKDRTNL